MTDQQHPITPPPELVELWYDTIDNQSTAWKQQLATRAAQWGYKRAHHDLLVRTEATLAQPEPQRPSHETAVRNAVESCLAQREKVLEAFIAKHGFCPDEAIQIEQRLEDGSSTWRIERRAALEALPDDINEQS